MDLNEQHIGHAVQGRGGGEDGEYRYAAWYCHDCGEDWLDVTEIKEGGADV